MNQIAKIIHYNQNEGKGIVNANGQTHNFEISHWRGAEAPRINSSVELEMDANRLIALRPHSGSIGGGVDSNSMSALVWIGCLFTGWIVPLIVYLVKKDDAVINAHARECLNYGINLIFAYFICLILTFILIGILGYFILGVCHLVFTIIGAVKASKGEQFKFPFIIRLIKQ